ncbi:MAG: GntR family transcriptional regulator [Flavobacteriia bacterium]|nr:MAG: GntR family transcriptional regulator [Flavobacteriia bacterium]
MPKSKSYTNFILDTESSVPYHAQIEAYLRELIKDKRFIDGKNLLPKEESLSKKFGVSRNTIRQAINKLVQEGLIERKKGVGSKVVQKKISTRLDNWISFTKEMKLQGIDVVNYLIDISMVNADKEVYKALSISKPQKIWCLKKIRGSKEAKYLYSISYFHPRTGISDKDNFKKPLYDLLEEKHDTIVTVSKEKLRAIIAGKELAEILNTDENDPVLKRERIVFDSGNRPVEYNIVYYKTDYFTYDIDIKREFKK